MTLMVLAQSGPSGRMVSNSLLPLTFFFRAC
jgi:hypothetical protein